MRQKVPYFFVILSLLLFSGQNSFALTAPRIYFAASEKEFFAGEDFRIAILLDTPFPVNALDLELGFSPRTLAFLGFDDRNSIIDTWKDSPLIYEEGVVRLRGGILRGFQGSAGELIQLTFRGVEEGKGQISLRSGKIYRSDGTGSEVALPVSFAEVLLGSGTPKKIQETVPADETPPRVSIQTMQDPVTGRDLLVLGASDQESGVGASFVRFRKWFFWSGWQRFRNPMQIPSGTWEINSRTLNGDGLTKEEIIYISRPLFAKSALLLAAMIIFTFFSFAYSRKRKNLRG